MRNRRRGNPKQQGFVLIAMSAGMLLLLGLVGMAFDFGRMYIAHNEAQLFTDAAALAAARELDGTPAGIERARKAVDSLHNRWNMGTEPFRGARVELLKDGRSVRVIAPENQIEITFLRAVGAPEKFTVPARSVAAIDPVRLIE